MNVKWQVLFRIAAALCSGFVLSANAVTVVEYYNKTLDAHFITGRANEQSLLDPVADFQRTGMTFQATAVASAPASLTKICRFYVSIASPFVNSHFYGRQGIDCETILAAAPRGFSWEDYDFAVTPPIAGVCPAGTTAIYRGFRAQAGSKTSNHRYTVSATTYLAAIASGYSGEGIAFCATSVTDVSATSVGTGISNDCLAYLKVGDSYTQEVVSSSFTLGTITVPGATGITKYTYQTPPPDALTRLFNGQLPTFVTSTRTEGYLAGSGVMTFMIDNGTTIKTLGTRSETGEETYLSPPVELPKSMTTGQVVSYTTTLTKNTDPTLRVNVSRVLTFRGASSVTVPAGTFPSACKFEFTESDNGTGSGIALSSTANGTSWSQGGLILKGDLSITAIAPGLGSYSYTGNLRTMSAFVGGKNYP